MTNCEKILEDLANRTVTFTDKGRPIQTLQPIRGFEHTTTPQHKADYKKLLDMIASFCGGVKGKTLLDIGCYYGYFCFQLTEMGAHTTGIDIDKHRVETCKCLSGHYGLGPTNPLFLNVDAMDYVPGKKFDYVLLLNTFHHILIQDEQKGWEMFNALINNSSGLFLQLRPNYSRYDLYICKNQDEIGPTLVEKTDAKHFHVYEPKIFGRKLIVFTA